MTRSATIKKTYNTKNKKELSLKEKESLKKLVKMYSSQASSLQFSVKPSYEIKRRILLHYPIDYEISVFGII